MKQLQHLNKSTLKGLPMQKGATEKFTCTVLVDFYKHTEGAGLWSKPEFG